MKMVKVLIIDDEMSTCQSIKIMGGFENNPSVQVFEARNGMEGYQLLEKENPDLIFLDMNMPVMDGTDLLELLDENKHKAKVIVVSGYTDFYYTSAAIRKKQVVDYIQKPLEAEQLRNAITKVSCDWDYNPINAQVTGNSEIRHLFGIFIENYTDVLKKNFNNSLELFLFFLSRQVQHYLSEAILYRNYRSVYQFAFMFEYSGDDYEFENHLESVLAALKKRYGIIAYAIYEEKVAVTEFWELALEICDYVNYMNLNSSKQTERRTRQNKNIIEKNTEKAREEIEKIISELVSCLKYEQKEQFEEYASQLTNCLKNQNYLSVYELKIIMSLLLRQLRKNFGGENRWIENIIAEKTGELYSVTELFTINYSIIWLRDLAERIWKEIVEQNNKMPESMRKILLYTEQHYSDKISLSDIAEVYYYNISSISRMFRKYMGVTFVEYLNSVRLDKAKEFLVHSDKMVSEIAEEVGFESLSYFSKQFKRKYGISPQEYRDNLHKNKV